VSFTWKDGAEVELFFISSTNDTLTTSGYCLHISNSGIVSLDTFTGTGTATVQNILQNTSAGDLDISGADREASVTFIRRADDSLYMTYSDTSNNFGIFVDPSPLHVYATSAYTILFTQGVVGNTISSYYSPTRSHKAYDWIGSTDVSMTYPTPMSWSFEKHIYASIGNDALSVSTSTSEETKVLLLVAKAYDLSNNVYRQIWFREDKTGAQWYELSTEGNYIYDATNDFSQIRPPIKNATLKSSIDGEVVISNINGVVKIYLPHNSYWFGKIDRKYWPSNGQSLNGGITSQFTYSGYYFDNLSEQVTIGSLDKNVYNDTVYCDDSRRLGINLELDVVETANTPLGVQNNTISMNTQFVGFDESGSEVGRGRYIEITGPTGKVKANTVHPPYVLGNLYQPMPGQFQIPAYERYNGSSYTGEYLVSSYLTTAGDRPQAFSAIYDYNDSSIPWGSAGPPDLSKLYNNPTYSPAGDTLLGHWYGITKNDLESSAGWNNKNALLVSDLGFTKGSKNVYVIATAMLDNVTEILVDYQVINTSSVTANRFALKAALELPVDLNRRVTKINIYVKLDNGQSTDFELANEFNIVGNSRPNYAETYMSEYSLQGTLLSQNIGFFFDEKDTKQYSLITGLNRVATFNGISIATTPGDNSSIYYNAVGGGNLQTDLFYKSNILREISTDYITGLVNGNGFFLIFTLDSTYALKASGVSGVLAFSAIKTLAEGAIDKNLIEDFIAPRDFVESTYNGAIALSPNGVFLTDGYKTVLVSDIVNSEFRGTSAIHSMYYNHLDHTIYFIEYDNKDVWRYRTIDQAWEHLSLGDLIGSVTADNINFIAPNSNGELSFLTDDNLYLSTTGGALEGEMVSNTITLSEPGEEKKLLKIDIDYIGTCTFSFYFDNDTKPAGKYRLDTLTTRDITSLAVKLNKNHPFRKFHYTITETTPAFKLYNITILYENLWEGVAGDSDQEAYVDRSYSYTPIPDFTVT